VRHFAVQQTTEKPAASLENANVKYNQGLAGSTGERNTCLQFI
jgi:hypothetical protein